MRQAEESSGEGNRKQRNHKEHKMNITGWESGAISAKEGSAQPSMRLVPILRGLGIDLQGHREFDEGMRRVGHHFADNFDRRRDF